MGHRNRDESAMKLYRYTLIVGATQVAVKLHG